MERSSAGSSSGAGSSGGAGQPGAAAAGFALEAEGIVKEFSGVRVLDGISVGIRRGEIMGLIGENGAGKSTLIKIVCGVYQPSAGSLRIDGKPAVLPDYIAAKKLGIALVPQEFNLINTLSVYENIFLGNEMRGKSGLLDKAAMRRAAAARLESLKMPLGVDRLVSDLSVAEKQMVEISKALMLDARILIMDEPTTTLTSRETEVLFGLMRELKARGVTLVFVSHKLHEIKTVCDRVTVLRDGKLISVDDIADVDERDIARKMVGRDFQQVFPPKRGRGGDDVILEVRGLRAKGYVKDASFTLRRGEILGFAGLVGAGRTELAEAVMGLRKAEAGEVWFEGKKARVRSAKDAVALGLGYLSEDRQGKGVVQGFGIQENISLISLGRYLRACFIDKKAEAAKAKEYTEAFNITSASMRSALRYLSGGNQQKVYLARWVDTDPKVLILDEPTRGIDVNAKREIYEFVHRLAERGISCIVVSSELEEVIGLCSRVYVMREGSIEGCLEGGDINEESIMFLATGIKEKGSR